VATLVLGDAPRGDDVIRREAVKAVVTADGALLMLLSPGVGDFKFPGGGRHDDEADEQCLARELSEECGRDLTGAPELLLTVVERRPATDRPGAVLEMVSRYYRCCVTEQAHEQQLDDYEKALGLTPRWVLPQTALTANRLVADLEARPPWTARELAVLEWLAGTGLTGP